MLSSLFNLLNKTKSDQNEKSHPDDLSFIGGILIEAAAADGKIDDSEIQKIKHSLIEHFEADEEKSNLIINNCLEKVDEPNSLHYFTSKINKEFDYDKKIKLIEILWEIILADNCIHDFESNLIRRLSGLLYISDVDCGNARKSVIKKMKEI